MPSSKPKSLPSTAAGIRTNSIPALLRTSAGASAGLSADGDGVGGGVPGTDAVRAASALLSGAFADFPNMKSTDQFAN